MAPTVPKKPLPTLPATVDGEIFQNVGKYARGSVLFAFEQIGGPKALGEWAAENPTDFYTKLFPKIITKEVEVTERRSIDELMDVLDGEYTADDPQELDFEAGPLPPLMTDDEPEMVWSEDADFQDYEE